MGTLTEFHMLAWLGDPGEIFMDDIPRLKDTRVCKTLATTAAGMEQSRKPEQQLKRARARVTCVFFV